MKVILLKFVKDLGREGDIIDVSDGFAVNSLFPKKLAKQATSDVINKQKMSQKSVELQSLKEKETALATLAILEGKTILFEEKLNEKGNLYHSLALRDIIRAIHEQYHVSTPNTFFKEKYSFKEKGKYTIEISAYNKVVKAVVLVEGK
jgi:large subunit ribosomal protein L9